MISRKGNELPIGFAMELAMDMDAMDIFSQMSDSEQAAAIDGAKYMNTREDMRDYVHSLYKKHQSTD